MALEDGEGIAENRVTFYRMAGHSHDGDNSSKIDFSAYDIYDIIDGEQLQALIGSVVQNGALRTTHLTVGDGSSAIVIDGSIPAAVSNLNVSSSVSTTSDGNVFMDVSWTIDSDSDYKHFLVELYKSESGVNGTYLIMQSVETTALSARFEWIDNNSGDGGQLYYKAKVYVISPIGIRGVSSSSSGVVPAVDTTAPSSPTFNDDFSNFDEGVKPAFKGIFVYLDENTEYDVKEMRGRYEYQVSISNTAASFDSASNLKAAGLSKSNYFLVNNLDVRSSAGGAKIDYYLRIRAVDSSGNYSSWVYYQDTADGGSGGAGTTTDSSASAINVLEIDAGVDVQANTITANEIFAGTITATEIASNTITADELSSLTITVGKHIQSSNYSSGGTPAGWKIDGSGNGYMNNIVARGTIHATSGTIGGETTGWTIASNVIQHGAGSGTVIFSTNGAGTPFIRLGSKTSFTSTSSGYWLDTANGMALGSNAWHVDVSGNMWWGNHSSYSAANYKVASWGGAYLLYARIGGAVSGSDTTTGKSWEINDGNITNVSTVNSIISTDYNAVGLNSVSGIINTAGRKVILRGYSGGDIRVGIAQTTADQPSYNVADDIAMFWDASASKMYFSVEQAFLVADGDVTINNKPTIDAGLTLTGTPTNTAGNYMLSRNAGGDLVWNGSTVGGTTYTFNSPLSESSGTVSLDALIVADFSGAAIQTGTESFVDSDTVLMTAAAVQDKILSYGYGDITGVWGTGSGLTGGGSSGSVSISHADTSTQASVNNSGQTFIQDITLDNFGHITAMSSATATGGSSDHGVLTGLGDDDHTQYLLTSGSRAMSGSLLGAAGSRSAPGYAFSVDTNTGMYRSGADEISFSLGNSSRVTMNQNYTKFFKPVYGVNGSATAPSYSFTADTDTGMYGAVNTLSFATGGTQRVTINSAGSVGIGYSSPSYRLSVNGTLYINSTAYFGYNSFTNGAVLPWFSNSSDLGSSSYYWDDFYHSGSTFTSDINLKDNIEDATYGLDFVNTLRPVTYTKREGGTGRNGPRTHHGFIAQEIETLLGDDADHIALWADGYHPEVLPEDDPSGEGQAEGYVYGLRYTEFIPILTKGIQELSAKLDAAEARIAELEAV